MEKKDVGDNATPPPPSVHDQAPIPTVAKGSGEQPVEHTASASKTTKRRMPRYNRVVWMNDDEVKTIDFVAIRQKLRLYHKPPENLAISNRAQATEYYRSVGTFIVGAYPDRGYEDGEYYYFFRSDWETGLAKTSSGDAVSKKTLEIMTWIPGNDATPPPLSVHDQAPIPTVAKGSGEQPVEHTASASKTTKRRRPRYTQVVWMNDDEVKTIDLVAIRQKLRLYHKPPENPAISNRAQATEYYRSVGTFILGVYPDRGYEDGEYYYYFWSDGETGLAKTSSGGAVSKKTLEIMTWIPGNDATPTPPGVHNQVPVSTLAKGNGEQPQEPARKSRWPWDNRVIWMSDDEVKAIDFVTIRQRLLVYHKPPENLVINNRDQATEYYRSIGYFMQGGWPTRGYEDGDYYYYFWIDEETGLVKTVSGDAVSKKTLEILIWFD